MTKLTKRTIDASKPKARDYFVFDDQLPCFGLRVMPSGKRSFVIQYRRNGRTRRVTLGAYGPLTPAQARARATELLGLVSSGRDPAEERALARHAPTVAALGERFLKEYVPQHCKTSTASEYRRSVELFINPALGKLKVSDLSRADVAGFHHSLERASYQANRSLGVLSKMLNLGEIWGLRPDGSNPCRHVKKFPEKKRERFLSAEELRRLGQVLREIEFESSETTAAVAAIRLLITTGCRLSEILTLKWEYIDKSGLIRLPDSKTGQKTIQIGQAVIDLLDSIPLQEGNPYVVPGRKPGCHLVDLQRPWRRIRKRSGLEGVRLHDLRHSYASRALAEGEGLTMIGKLLGHAELQSTARYAHLAEVSVKRAADMVSASIAADLVSK